MTNATYVIFEGEGNQSWRWHLKNDNGIIAHGGEGFSSKQMVENSIEKIKENANNAPIVENNDNVDKSNIISNVIKTKATNGNGV